MKYSHFVIRVIKLTPDLYSVNSKKAEAREMGGEPAPVTRTDEEEIVKHWKEM